MLPDTTTALWVAFFAVVPGYVAVSTFAGRQRTWRGAETDLKTVLQALWVSAIVQLVALPVTLWEIYPVRNHLDQHPFRVAGWGFLVVFALPWVGGRVAALVATSTGIAKGGRFAWLWTPPPAPSAWDWFFASEPPDGRFVIIEFADGRQVAGTFSKGSIAITSPEARGIFLAQEWVLDASGNIVEAVPGSEGILISDISDVRSLRVLRSKDD
jgi:hypothetical protein